MSQICNALIKTHHITSRKKVAVLTQAAKKHDVYALLRSGGSPGIMYAEGSQSSVGDWAAEVKRLRYKDYQLLRRPAEISSQSLQARRSGLVTSDLHETDTVKDFGAEMDRRGVLQWWRQAMEFDTPDDRL